MASSVSDGSLLQFMAREGLVVEACVVSKVPKVTTVFAASASSPAPAPAPAASNLPVILGTK
jgi:hypothetical protein